LPGRSRRPQPPAVSRWKTPPVCARVPGKSGYAIQLPNGYVMKLVRAGTHCDYGHTIFIFDIWASAADYQAEKPGNRWDATFSWNGPHPAPFTRVINHMLKQVETSVRVGAAGYDQGVEKVFTGRPDPYGHLAHPSMRLIMESAG
jgi:hypothetical protein